MAKEQTDAAYAVRMDRVVQYIWEHLDAQLDLETLADVACFSPYHFHRLYRMITGETTAQTVRRLRLHRAAAQLGEGGKTIEQIAKRAGYGSVEAFTRAFSSAYGQPPAAYRAEREAAARQFAPETVTSQFKVTVEEHPALTLVGFPHRGDYQEIGRAFERLYAWAFPAGIVMPEARHIGVYDTDETAVPKAELKSFAGVSVDGVPSLPDGAETVSVPASLVAKLQFKGPYAELEEPYRYLYGVWLPQSGYEPRDFPCFEDYLNNPREVPPPELLTDIYLPLLPKGSEVP